VVFSLVNNIEVRGITLVNAGNWTLTTYRCNDVVIDNVAIFGYRTNSDAFDICNSNQVNISNCFARSGDDLFQVKTLGAPSNATAANITFNNCIAWNSKARCFGITGEVEKDISKIRFQNCVVLYRDAIWDNDRIGSLVVIVENGNGKIDDLRFENIEINYDRGRAINCTIYNSASRNCSIQNIVFQNITYRSGMTSQLKAQSSSNCISASFSNVRANGNLIMLSNINSNFITDTGCNYIVK
jgi:polygalacturonase